MVITINNLATISNVTALIPYIIAHINDAELIFNFNPIAFAKIIPAAILARVSTLEAVFQGKMGPLHGSCNL